MKKHFLLTAIAIAVGSLVVCGVLFLKDSTKRTNMHTAPDRLEKGNEVLQKKEISLLEQLEKVKLDELSFEEENELEEDGVVVITEEEMRADAARWRRIHPIYESQAPVVLDKIMMEEKINDKWTEEVKTEALEIIGSEEFEGTDLLDVECHESLCRMRLFHDDLSSFERFEKGGGHSIGPWNTDLVAKKNDGEDGTVKTIMFFSDRDGNSEPFQEMMDRLDKIAISMLKEE